MIVEAQILALLADLKRNFDTALLLITHNLGIVAEACDRVAVMYAGQIVEEGPARDVFAEPAHPYTRELLRSTISLETTELHSIPGAPPNLIDPPPGCRFHPRCPERDAGLRRGAAGRAAARRAAPRAAAGCTGRSTRFRRAASGRSSATRSGWRMRPEIVAPTPEPSPDGSPLVSVRDLKTYYSIRGTFVDRLVGREAGVVRAVDGVSLDLRRGEVLGARRRVGQRQDDARPDAARARSRDERERSQFEGQEITGRSERELRASCGRQMQIVFQDPHASLNPAMTIGQAVGHPLQIHGLASESRAAPAPGRRGARAGRPRAGAEQFLDKYPSDLSGGQKQRAVIARAIILNPALLVADEPVSMLDMSVRAKILELMIALKRDLDLTYLYITHDLATAQFFCDRIAIMYLGQIVEIGPAEAIYADPKHPYTQALLRAIPEPDPERAVPRDLPRGEVPDAAMPPLGCPFHPRCPRAFEPCGWESRDLRDLLEMRWALAAGAAGAAVVEEEQALVGDLGVLARPATNVRLSAGRKAADIAALLDRIRGENPEEPFWRGVERIATDELKVNIDFHEPRVPQLERVGEVDVSCHLYDSPPAQA